MHKCVLPSCRCYNQSNDVDPFWFSTTISVTVRLSGWYLSFKAAETQRVCLFFPPKFFCCVTLGLYTHFMEMLLLFHGLEGLAGNTSVEV